MFSLIITIVSIALVVALIAATMYYGADTLTRGQAAANAAAIISGGEQVLAAMTAFQAQTGRYPNNLEELITSNYLRSFPELASAGFDLISSAHAAPVDGVGDWLYDHETPHLAYVGTLDMDTCAEVNNQISEQRIVLNVIDPDPRAQCVVKGAQDPVVVFRHPGEKDFTGWDEHPQIPEVGWSGALQEVGEAVKDGTYVPDEDDVCMHGCSEEDLGGGEPGGPEEPQGPEGGAQLSLNTWQTFGGFNSETCAYAGENPGIASYCASVSGLSGQSEIPYIYMSMGGYTDDYTQRKLTCLPLYQLDSTSLQLNGESVEAYTLSKMAGVTVSATLTQIFTPSQFPEGAPFEALPNANRYMYLGVFNGTSWSIASGSGPVSTTYQNGVSYSEEHNAAAGDVGLCGFADGGGVGVWGAYRLDLTASRNGDSSSTRVYLGAGMF